MAKKQLNSERNPTICDGDEIIDALNGKVMSVPDLLSYMDHWPSGEINDNIERLGPFVDELIEHMLDSPERIAKHKADDYALFTAMWFPYLDWEDLQTVSYFTIWLFLWDDSIDTAEGDLAKEIHQANKYRDDTLLLFEHYFTGKDAGDVVPDGINAAIKNLAEGLLKFFTRSQTDRFLKEMKRYILSCGQEQSYQLDRIILGVKPYIHLRLGTTAVFPLCALSEFVIGEHLPEFLMDSQPVHSIWAQANLGVIYVNDLLSLKKELKHGCTLNLVSAHLVEGKSLQEAVDAIVELFSGCIKALDAAQVTLERLAENTPWHDAVERYADSCRFMIIATYHFSVASERYGIKEYRNPQTDEFLIPLGDA